MIFLAFVKTILALVNKFFQSQKIINKNETDYLKNIINIFFKNAKFQLRTQDNKRNYRKKVPRIKPLSIFGKGKKSFSKSNFQPS